MRTWVLHAAQGRPEEALTALQKLADQSSSPEAYLALARLQERLASADDAQASVTKAVALATSASPQVRAEALAALSSLELIGGTGRFVKPPPSPWARSAPRAGMAVPHLRFILASNRVVDGTILTDAQMAESMREEDFRKAVRNALQKIAGR